MKIKKSKKTAPKKTASKKPAASSMAIIEKALTTIAKYAEEDGARQAERYKREKELYALIDQFKPLVEALSRKAIERAEEDLAEQKSAPVVQLVRRAADDAELAPAPAIADESTQLS